LLTATAFATLANAPKRGLIVTNKDYTASIGALENTHCHDEGVASDALRGPRA